MTPQQIGAILGSIQWLPLSPPFFNNVRTKEIQILSHSNYNRESFNQNLVANQAVILLLLIISNILRANVFNMITHTFSALDWPSSGL